MVQPAIEVHDISKLYRIGLADQNSKTLAGSLATFFRSPLHNYRKLRSISRVTREDIHANDVIWALKNISFSVETGEVLGIIGANGAGKSTLLKVLGGITEPTMGRAVIRGRVASLLEVGTGFHSELTGRENIYLNGTILGMRKPEIDRKFDQIVAFSGVERFIDTPVKRYSSGMVVRLAFSVAAHLDPEVLAIDEVLAVGDMEFQKKCIGKMGDVAKSGRTILLVSHNMAAIESLCDRVIVIEQGVVDFEGPPGQAIQKYSGSVGKCESQVDLTDHQGRHPSIRKGIMQRLRMLDEEGCHTTIFRMGGDICFEISMRGLRELHAPYVGIGVNSISGQRLCTFNSRQQHTQPVDLRKDAVVSCVWHDCLLLPGLYSLELWVKDAQEPVDVVKDAARFEVIAADIHGTGKVQTATGFFEGRATWSVNRLSKDDRSQQDQMNEGC